MSFAHNKKYLWILYSKDPFQIGVTWASLDSGLGSIDGMSQGSIYLSHSENPYDQVGNKHPESVFSLDLYIMATTRSYV